MSNRQQRRSGGVEKNAVAKMLDGVMDAAKKAKAEQGVDGDEGAMSGEFVLPMPDSQDVGESAIRWEWEFGTGHVTAFYIRKLDNVHQKQPGDYFWYFDNPDGFNSMMTAEDAQEMAQVLASVAKWKDEWRSRAGEFLAVADINKEEGINE